MSDVEMKPYVITYKHNRTGEECTCTLWATSQRDARIRFSWCDERQSAERIKSVKESK